MNNIQIKVTVQLNQNHALNEADLGAMKPAIERALAGALPQSLAIDTIKVTKIKNGDRPS